MNITFPKGLVVAALTSVLGVSACMPPGVVPMSSTRPSSAAVVPREADLKLACVEIDQRLNLLSSRSAELQSEQEAARRKATMTNTLLTGSTTLLAPRLAAGAAQAGASALSAGSVAPGVLASVIAAEISPPDMDAATDGLAIATRIIQLKRAALTKGCA